MSHSHPIRRRYLAEQLVRLRRADEQPRYVASQRAGRIDPNPHQIDAVIFALQRIGKGQGGCILADEVGLGKTIEAGLVIAQRRAEGARRVLLITPKPLLGQWRHELLTLFGIDAEEVVAQTDLRRPGVYILGREQAGGERGAERLLEAAPFDLAVIDEAHEIFAGLYKRYDRHGRIRQRGRAAKTAARVKRALAGTPVLLLTATPIQNSLTELWGLVQYVEPTGTLLGDLPTFRSLFCEGDDRTLRPGQGQELRRRVSTVCRRTLRRQAQLFMKRPFVDRQARLFEYSMGEQERALYEDVTAYLLRPRLCAFAGGQRRLLLLGFHRRMASSLAALADSLERVAKRLEGMLVPTVGRGNKRDDQTLGLFAGYEAGAAAADDDAAQRFADDLEQEEADELDEPEEGDELDDGEAAEADEGASAAAPDNEIRQELALVRDLVERARTCPTDAKLEQLLVAVRTALSRPDGSGKVVIFTESLSTQDYLAEKLAEREVVEADEVTLFRGTNQGPRANAALERWLLEVGAATPGSSPSRSVAIRLALVHEFSTRSRIFIATEAGAKGLNLQFCDTVINYDLPWNPQRIEQRIGRCHRYGQTRTVTVINFLNRDNAAQRLTFEILSRKLDLFGTVLDASDDVLHEPGTLAADTLASALGMDFEQQLERIYERARTLEEIEAELAALRDRMGEERGELEQTHQRTAGLIESRLDETVRGSFSHLAEGVPQGLADFDATLAGLLQRFVQAIGAKYEVRDDGPARWFRLKPHRGLPDPYSEGGEILVGPRPADAPPTIDRLHLGHPLVIAAVREARAATAEPFMVEVEACEHPGLVEHRGQRGHMHVIRIDYDGFEPVQSLCPVALLEDGSVLSLDAAEHLLTHAGLHDVDAFEPKLAIDGLDLDDALQERRFVDAAAVEPHERERLAAALDRIERHMDDRVMVWEQRCEEIEQRVQQATARRDAAVGTGARLRAERELADVEQEHEAARAEVDRLRGRDDEDYETWRLGALARRYHVPQVETILDLGFCIR